MIFVTGSIAACFLYNMNARKVWKFLSLLSTEEQQRWLNYLAFQYGDRQEYQQQLASFLVQKFPHPPEDEEAWRHLYPDEPYNDGRIRKLSGDLTTQLEQFLSFASQEASHLDQRIHLLRRMIAEADLGLFGQTWKKACKDVYRFAGSAAELAEYRYELEVINREYRLTHRMKDGAFWFPPQEGWWGESDSLQRISYLNSAWNLYQMLDLAVNSEINSSRTGNRVLIPLKDESLEIARTHPILSRFPLVGLYLKILVLVQEGKKEDIDSLSRYLFRHHHRLPDTEKSLLFSSLLNHLIIKINKGESHSVILTLLDLYEWGLNNKMLLSDGYLIPGHYKNVIGLCLRIRDLERARSFLEKYKSVLPEDVREELPALNRIYLSFAEKDFTKTIQLASKSRFSSPLDEIDARAVLLQAHFETGMMDLEWAENQINSLIRYTRSRNSLPGQFKRIYIERFRIYRKLFLAQTQAEFQEIAVIVEKNPTLDKGGWVAEKLKPKSNR